jgi:hypothetical protein
MFSKIFIELLAYKKTVLPFLEETRNLTDRFCFILKVNFSKLILVMA